MRWTRRCREGRKTRKRGKVLTFQDAVKYVIAGEWKECWTPSAISLVTRARIVKELHWTYRDFKDTPADWLKETVWAIAEISAHDDRRAREKR